jgi:hypothetical protein
MRFHGSLSKKSQGTRQTNSHDLPKTIKQEINKMPSAYDLYEFYLEAADLRDQSHAVKIASVKAEPIFNPITKKDERKIVLTFEGKKKTMPLNKTQVGAMIELFGDDYTTWTGKQITITPATATNHTPGVDPHHETQIPHEQNGRGKIRNREGSQEHSARHRNQTETEEIHQTRFMREKMYIPHIH